MSDFCSDPSNADTIECGGVITGLGWLAACIIVSVLILAPIIYCLLHRRR